MNTYPHSQERRRRFPLVRLLLVLILIALAVYLVPRALDRTPPELLVEGVESGRRYGGQVELTIQGEDAGRGLSKLRFREDGVQLAEIQLRGKFAQTIYVWDTKLLTSGTVHLLEVELVDASLWHLQTHQSFDLIVDNDPPQLSIRSVPASATQGQALAFFVRADEELRSVKGRFLENDVPFFAAGKWMRGMVGIPVGAKTGAQKLEVHALDLAGNESTLSSEVSVQKGNFHTGIVQLPKTKTSLLSDQKKKAENREKREEALRTSEPKQMWVGPFQKPTQGVTTSTFGSRRVYNNGVVRSVHYGWDIANTEGTPVYAANDGRVVLAEELPIHGNNVLVDHGQGIVSGYAHLSAILVQVGDQVGKGQLVGRMGTTGQSTGSHLHWEMFAHEIPVDPQPWLGEAFDAP